VNLPSHENHWFNTAFVVGGETFLELTEISCVKNIRILCNNKY